MLPLTTQYSDCRSLLKRMMNGRVVVVMVTLTVMMLLMIFS